MKLTPVRRDHPVTVHVEGGYKRVPAPSDGAAWDEGESCGFISQRDLETVLGDLKLLQQGYKGGRRR